MAETKLTEEQRKKVIDSLVVNCDCPTKKKDRLAALNAKDDKELMSMAECKKMYEEDATKNQTIANPDGSRQVFNQQTKKWEYQPPPEGNRPTENVAKPKNFAEALQKFGTPEDMEVWNKAISVHNQHKTALVERLVVNADGQERVDAIGIYDKMTVGHLEILVSAQPRADTSQRESLVANYIGAVGAAPLTSPIMEDPLPIPDYAWGSDNRRAKQPA